MADLGCSLQLKSSPWVQTLCLLRNVSSLEQPPADARSLLQSWRLGKARRALPLQELAGGEDSVRGKHHLVQF